MTWQGEERRSGKDRRVVERRRTTRYDARTIIVIDGITWVEERETSRRVRIRRKEDREKVAAQFLLTSKPD